MRQTQDTASYLARLPDDQRRALADLRAAILAACPDATELIAYGMPGFKYRGRPLVYMAAAKQHLGLYGPAVAECEQDLSGYDTSKGTIRFTPRKPLPKSLVRKLVRGRMATVEAEEAPRAAAKKSPAEKPATRTGTAARKRSGEQPPARRPPRKAAAGR